MKSLKDAASRKVHLRIDVEEMTDGVLLVSAKGGGDWEMLVRGAAQLLEKGGKFASLIYEAQKLQKEKNEEKTKRTHPDRKSH